MVKEQTSYEAALHDMALLDQELSNARAMGAPIDGILVRRELAQRVLEREQSEENQRASGDDEGKKLKQDHQIAQAMAEDRAPPSAYGIEAHAALSAIFEQSDREYAAWKNKSDKEWELKFTDENGRVPSFVSEIIANKNELYDNLRGSLSVGIQRGTNDIISYLDEVDYGSEKGTLNALRKQSADPAKFDQDFKELLGTLNEVAKVKISKLNSLFEQFDEGLQAKVHQDYQKIEKDFKEYLGGREPTEQELKQHEKNLGVELSKSIKKHAEGLPQFAEQIADLKGAEMVFETALINGSLEQRLAVAKNYLREVTENSESVIAVTAAIGQSAENRVVAEKEGEPQSNKKDLGVDKEQSEKDSEDPSRGMNAGQKADLAAKTDEFRRVYRERTGEDASDSRIAKFQRETAAAITRQYNDPNAENNEHEVTAQVTNDMVTDKTARNSTKAAPETPEQTQQRVGRQALASAGADNASASDCQTCGKYSIQLADNKTQQREIPVGEEYKFNKIPTHTPNEREESQVRTV